MRIAWFTPLDSATGIARFSREVLRALCTRADVEVWAAPTADPVDIPWCPVNRLDKPRAAAAHTESADVRVYNMGNNFRFHRRIFDTYQRASGVVIAHDKVMQDFFLARSEHQYRKLMTYYCGRQGGAAAVRASARHETLFDAEFALRYPLIEPCLWNAEAVIAHSKQAGASIAARYGDVVPVSALELPLCTQPLDERDRLSRTDLGLPVNRLVLVAAGYVGRGKRLEVVLGAIASDERLRKRCYLVIAGGGDPAYVTELRQMVDTHGLEECVAFVDRPSDLVLQSHLAAADICVNLRYPSTESSSAALVEQMFHGKPVLVYDVGVYAELPADVVVRIEPDLKPATVAAALHDMVADPERRVAIGARARQYARRHFDPAVYVESLLDVLERAIRNRAGLHAIDEASLELAGMSSIEEIAAAAHEAARRFV